MHIWIKWYRHWKHYITYCTQLAHVRERFETDLLNKVKPEGDPDDAVVERILKKDFWKILGTYLQALTDARTDILYSKDNPPVLEDSQDVNVVDIIEDDPWPGHRLDSWLYSHMTYWFHVEHQNTTTACKPRFIVLTEYITHNIWLIYFWHDHGTSVDDGDLY